MINQFVSAAHRSQPLLPVPLEYFCRFFLIFCQERKKVRQIERTKEKNRRYTFRNADLGWVAILSIFFLFFSFLFCFLFLFFSFLNLFTTDLLSNTVTKHVPLWKVFHIINISQSGLNPNLAIKPIRLINTTKYSRKLQNLTKMCGQYMMSVSIGSLGIGRGKRRLRVEIW